MKNHQSGSATVVLLGVLGAMLLAGVVAAGLLISAHNAGNAMENAIKATYENNQTVLSTYSQKVAEAAQVPDMMRDDLIKVAKAALEGRYGDEGLKATLVAIQEQNPVVSEKLYIELQNIIKAGRDQFQANQTRLIDQKANYETQLGSFPRGTLLSVLGYPKIDLEKYKTVTTQQVKQTFETGIESGPIQLRPKQ